MDLNIKQKVSRFIYKSSDLTWPDGIVDFENQSFVVNGIKPIAHVQDEIESAFVWCWSVKDHLIEILIERSPNIDKKTIESEINSFECLALCSDIANGLKHKSLKKSRSNKFAKLSIVQSITVNSKTVSRIQKLDDKYFITPQSNDCVKIEAVIVDCNGGYLSDAYKCLTDSLAAWESIFKKYERT